ncbi:MAG: hypothetical protein ACW98Y_08620 [Candidatus Thorarchaeota archaeon]|jgi:hypothetical protein
MTEIKALTKIALLAYGGVCLLFGFMYIFFAETLIAALIPGWEVNAFHPRVLGGFLVVIGFFDILMILNKGWEWEHIKLTYMALFAFILPMIIGQILVLALLPTTPAFVNEMFIEIPLESVLLILGIISYLKQGE